MAETSRRTRILFAALAVVVVGMLAAGAMVWRDDILRTGLDPKEPFQTYNPPPAPDYARRDSWSLLPSEPQTWADTDPVADVFFVGPTIYDGGVHWNAPIGEERSEAFFSRTIGPNYVGPFVRVGRIFAPRYRQASLYSMLTLRDDAREARRFAYGDVRRAFRQYMADYNHGRPFLIVGVEQGGTLASRLLAEEVAGDAGLRGRLVAAYLIQTAVPVDAPPIPLCTSPTEPGCLAAWMAAYEGDREQAQQLRDRSLVWTRDGELTNLSGPAACYNPILGQVSDESAPARLARGATNATGLEWGARPALQTRQVSAGCDHSVLRVSRPRSAAFRSTGSWADRRKMPGYNLFYGDLEANAEARLNTLMADPDFAHAARPIPAGAEVSVAPVHRID
ncbi:MAG: DUF3089 domain-containing protein [Phenylobacterium sp.]|uniref:DUF3089 domain-containing protein n=1 Tax=Phenylobacterium sp. TaxID=1871053 RepID=UPI0027195F1B|nr:DUF3089 domain-containing protein [Phenylobacterium sp.]MDO8411780.1 DUF3089 domain-containing protein [Phenylobacterium sp.]